MPIKEVRYLIIMLTVLTGILMINTELLAQFAGGQGTYEDPWHVATAEQLDRIRDYLGSVDDEEDPNEVVEAYHFIQVADIDLGVAPWNEGEGWLPIGTEEHPAHLDYNGNGHTIYGLYINRPESDNVGLFGYTGTTSPYDLHLESVDIVGRNNVGSMIGKAMREKFPNEHFPLSHNISATGTVRGYSNVGGLYGCQSGSRSRITNSFSAVDVIGFSEGEVNIGGVVGLSDGSEYISNSYASGSVTAVGMGRNVGGLIGFANKSYSVYTNCYSRAKVIGGENTGGLIGAVKSGNAKGYNGYWDIEISGQSESAMGEGKTTAEMTFPYSEDTYKDWNFKDIWRDDIYGVANDGYPFIGRAVRTPFPAKQVYPSENEKIDIEAVTLAWLPQYNSALNNMETDYVISFGTDNPPTNIIDKKPVALNVSYALPNELEYGTTYFWQVMPLNKSGIADDCPVWSFKTVSIGEKFFAGGAGDKTEPWKIETASHLENMRLFTNQKKHFELEQDIVFVHLERKNQGKGWTPIGERKETAFNGVFDGKGHIIKGLYIDSDDDSVGLFGYLSEAKIENLNLIDAQVKGNTYVGGIAGTSDMNSEISHCAVMGEINGVESVGGIVGKNNESTIIKSANKAKVNGDKYVGGIAGRNSSSSIRNCYNKGAVSGGERVGGVVGHNSRGYLAHSYSVGLIEGESLVGGFAGSYLESGSNDFMNYWDMVVSGQNSSAAGIGKITEEMTFPYAEDVYVGWDFDNVWKHDYDHSKNDGYPYLWEEIILSTDKDTVLKPLALSMRNYPNPFNPETTISFNLPKSGEVELAVYNIKGQLVKRLVNGPVEAGQHKIVWSGEGVSSGLYFYRLTTPEGSLINKMMLLK